MPTESPKDFIRCAGQVKAKNNGATRAKKLYKNITYNTHGTRREAQEYCRKKYIHGRAFTRTPLTRRTASENIHKKRACTDNERLRALFLYDTSTICFCARFGIFATQKARLRGICPLKCPLQRYPSAELYASAFSPHKKPVCTLSAR